MEKSIHSAQYGVFLRVFREARRRAGLTQLDLAAKVGATQSFISKCERGERRIDVVELRTFCEAFGVTPVRFLGLFEKALASAELPTRGRRTRPPANRTRRSR